MLFETLCRKSFLMLATRVCNLVIRAFAFRQFFENFFLRGKRRSNFANFGRNFFNGWHGSVTTAPRGRFFWVQKIVGSMSLSIYEIYEPWSLSNQSLLGSRSRHCYGAATVPFICELGVR